MAGVQRRRLDSTARRRLAAAALVVAGLALYPALFPGALNLGVTLVLYAAMATAWDVLGGWAGQLSLGHAALVGLGAYTFGLLTQAAGWQGSAGLAAAVAAVALAAAAATLAWGWITFRLRGPYFTLSSIAVAEILRLVATNARRLTGGAQGLFVFSLPRPLGLDLFDRTVEFYLALGLLALALGVAWWLSWSRFGYYLQAIREDEEAAMALGIHPLRYKLGAFVISGVLTALAGAVYGIFLSFFEPRGVFSIELSVSVALMAIIGGTGTTLGPLAGAALLTVAADWLRVIFQQANLLVYGVLIVLVVRFAPRGIAGAAAALARRWSRARSAHPAGEGLEHGLRRASGSPQG